MRYLHSFVSLPFFFLLIITSIQVKPQTVVAEFGNHEITLNEFERAYAKNVGSWEEAENDSITDYKNFLDLYVKFKMKLRDAEVRAYDRDQSLIDELAQYQKQVGVSYIIEKQINEPGIEQLYNRKKEEFRVSHIMFRPDSSGDEAARQKALEVLDSIKNGASFEEMAERHSDDRYSAVNGGDIYFVSAGILPYEFEDAMYTLQPGEVYAEPVKTRFGYHLIKVTERQPATYKIKASHILISFANSEGKVDSAAALQKADTVLAKLKAGTPFEDLVQKYSDDTGTKPKLGDLGYFERRMMVREFDEAAFKLKVGEISGIVKSSFGYHIIKLTDKMEFPPLSEIRDNLKDTFNKQRYQYEYDQLLAKFKKKYNFTINDEAVDYLAQHSDSLRFGMVHPQLSEISDRELFTYADKSVSIGAFLDMANKNTKITGKAIDNNDEINNAINLVCDDFILEEEAMNLPKTDKEFAQLMNDYRDGIYIFKIQEDEVWNKVKVDSADVYNYWEKNKDKYAYNERISFSEIFAKKDTIINQYYAWLQNGADFDSLAMLYTERPAMRTVKGHYQLQDVNASDFSQEANKITKVGTYTEPVSFAGGYSIFRLDDRQPPRLKTFEEAKAEVSGEYQEMFSKKLEDDYINRLYKRYEPEVYYDELENAFKKGKGD